MRRLQEDYLRLILALNKKKQQHWLNFMVLKVMLGLILKKALTAAMMTLFRLLEVLLKKNKGLFFQKFLWIATRALNLSQGLLAKRIVMKKNYCTLMIAL